MWSLLTPDRHIPLFFPGQIFVYRRPDPVPAGGQLWPGPGGPPAAVWPGRPVQPQRGVRQGGGLLQRRPVRHAAGLCRKRSGRPSPRPPTVCSFHFETPSLFYFFASIRTTCCGINWVPRSQMEAAPRRLSPPTGELWSCSPASSAAATIWESAVSTWEHTGEGRRLWCVYNNNIYMYIIWYNSRKRKKRKLCSISKCCMCKKKEQDGKKHFSLMVKNRTKIKELGT